MSQGPRGQQSVIELKTSGAELHRDIHVHVVNDCTNSEAS